MKGADDAPRLPAAEPIDKRPDPAGLRAPSRIPVGSRQPTECFNFSKKVVPLLCAQNPPQNFTELVDLPSQASVYVPCLEFFS
jgi:hypothetical protein